MEPLVTLSDLFKTAIAHGALGFTLQTGLRPMTYSAKGVQMYEMQPSSSEDIEEILRLLASSRKVRQLRTTGAVHFKSTFDGTIPMLCDAKMKGDKIRVEIRKMAA